MIASVSSNSVVVVIAVSCCLVAAEKGANRNPTRLRLDKRSDNTRQCQAYTLNFFFQFRFQSSINHRTIKPRKFVVETSIPPRPRHHRSTSTMSDLVAPLAAASIIGPSTGPAQASDRRPLEAKPYDSVSKRLSAPNVKTTSLTYSPDPRCDRRSQDNLRTGRGLLPRRSLHRQHW